jgi:hypothetical protein
VYQPYIDIVIIIIIFVATNDVRLIRLTGLGFSSSLFLLGGLRCFFLFKLLHFVGQWGRMGKFGTIIDSLFIRVIPPVNQSMNEYESINNPLSIYLKEAETSGMEVASARSRD